eukprot:1565561-Rhodomonas_salina.1
MTLSPSAFMAVRLMEYHSSFSCWVSDFVSTFPRPADRQVYSREIPFSGGHSTCPAKCRRVFTGPGGRGRGTEPADSSRQQDCIGPQLKECWGSGRTGIRGHKSGS